MLQKYKLAFSMLLLSIGLYSFSWSMCVRVKSNIDWIFILIGFYRWCEFSWYMKLRNVILSFIFSHSRSTRVNSRWKMHLCELTHVQLLYENEQKQMEKEQLSMKFVHLLLDSLFKPAFDVWFSKFHQKVYSFWLYQIHH